MDNDKIDPSIDPDKVFNEVFEQALQILKQAIEYADKPINPDAPLGVINQHMAMLEGQVQEFVKENQEVIDAAKQKNQAEGKDNSTALSKESQRLINRSKTLIQEANAKQEELAEKLRQGQAVMDAEIAKGGGQKQSTSSKVEPRKNKFRRVGGNKNWKPL